MKIADLLAPIAKAGGHVSAEGNRLRFTGPRDLLTDELREALRRDRGRILEWLRSPPTTSDLVAFDCAPTALEPWGGWE